MEDQHWGQRLLEYLDDTMLADPMPDTQVPMDDKDPCTLQGADLHTKDVQLRLGLRGKDLH